MKRIFPAILGLMLICLPSFASAANLTGNAVYFKRSGVVEFCLYDRNACYTFGNDNGTCSESLLNSMVFHGGRYNRQEISQINEVGTIAEAIRLLGPSQRREGIFIDLFDCGAPLGGDYAGVLCLDFTRRTNPHAGMYEGCFAAREVRRLRQYGIPLD